MRKLILLAMALGLTSQTHVQPAVACVGSIRTVFFFEFPPGSSSLAGHAATSFRIDMQYHVSGGKYVDAYNILASGDLAEGEQWSSATAQARLADNRLGEARAQAIRAMIASQPKEIRSSEVRINIRENRQVFTAEQLTSDPRLNERLRAGVSADVRIRRKKRRAGVPVPVC